MTNSKNMTMEERVAQRVKTSALGEFMTEDDVTEVVRRAIEKAFFQPRTEGGYNPKTLPPVVVEMATKSFETIMQSRAEAMATELAKDPAISAAILEACAQALPKVMHQVATGFFYRVLTDPNETPPALQAAIVNMRNRGMTT